MHRICQGLAFDIVAVFFSSNEASDAVALRYEDVEDVPTYEAGADD